jgi:predicted nucleotidyltransferase
MQPNQTPAPVPPDIEEIHRRIRARRADLERLGASFVGVFGSCARGAQRQGSDIDLAVDLRPGFGYFDLGEMEQILNDEFNLEVHIIDFDGLTERHQSIKREMIRVF